MRKKYVVGLMALVLAFTGCGTTASEEVLSQNSVFDSPTIKTETVVVPKSFEKLSGMDKNELKKYFGNNGEYSDIKTVGDHMEISVTKEQKDHWKEYAKESADKQEKYLTDISPKYKASCNSTCDTVNVYYDTAISFQDAFSYIGKVVTDCALYQLFDGKEEYAVNLNVYNVDTGKLVAGGDLEKDDVSYGDEEWKKSYTLNRDEENKLHSSTETNTYTISSTFTDAITVINILQASGGNGYTGLYINSDGNVILQADQKQVETIKQNMDQYFSELQKQFAGLGEKYNIALNSDTLTLSFDKELDKQEQANYCLYAETICMLQQILDSDDSSYYLNLYIYDSATGEKISEGNTQDGISWQMEE